MKCPRCKMGSIEWVKHIVPRYAKSDIIAVCRHVRKCGFRLLIPIKFSKNIKQREIYLEQNWQTG